MNDFIQQYRRQKTVSAFALARDAWNAERERQRQQETKLGELKHPKLWMFGFVCVLGVGVTTCSILMQEPPNWVKTTKLANGHRVDVVAERTITDDECSSFVKDWQSLTTQGGSVFVFEQCENPHEQRLVCVKFSGWNTANTRGGKQYTCKTWVTP